MHRIAFVALPFDSPLDQRTNLEKRFWRSQWSRRVGANRTVEIIESHGLTPFDAPEVPYTGIYLLSFFREEGWDLHFVDLWNTNEEGFNNKVAARKLTEPRSEVFLFSPFTANYHYARECVSIIKRESPGALCIAGGHHVSERIEDALRDGFDFVVLGRAESALREMARIGCHDPEMIPSAAFFNKDQEVVLSDRPPSSARLTDAPFPAYEILPLRYRRSYYTRLFTSHGCPFRCVFCSSKLWTGMKPRLKSLNRIGLELELIKQHVEFEEIYVGDETFTSDKDHALAAAAFLADTGIPWGAETRIDLANPEVLKELGRLGCKEMDFGLESTSPDILKLANKKIDPSSAPEVLRATSEAGIRTHVNLMIGLPGETKRSARKTVDDVCGWLQRGIVNTVDYFITVPYPGSDLYQNSQKYGLRIRSNDWRLYRENTIPVYDLETLNAEQIYDLWIEGLERFTEACID